VGVDRGAVWLEGAVCLRSWVVRKWVKLDCAQFVCNSMVEAVGVFDYLDGFPGDGGDIRSQYVLGLLFYQI
jgi:hypothetical protein